MLAPDDEICTIIAITKMLRCMSFVASVVCRRADLGCVGSNCVGSQGTQQLDYAPSCTTLQYTLLYMLHSPATAHSISYVKLKILWMWNTRAVSVANLSVSRMIRW